jgi:Bacteriocin-protection, YdeI or OmpD-Associated/Domain of unknown function (DUF1905)
MQFRATLDLDGKTATGITVPGHILAGLGAGKRPKVVVTLRGHTFRAAIGSMNGLAKIPVSAETRAAAQVSAGDELDVTVEADTAPRVVELPGDLAAALGEAPAARAFYDGLSPSRQNAYVSWVTTARKPETRQRRVEQSVQKLTEGKPQP